MALNEGGPQSVIIDIMFDTHREISITYVERGIRGEVQGVQLANITAAQIIRRWRRFLNEMNNKTSLIRFLSNEFKKEEYKEILQRQRKVLFTKNEEKCWKITGESVEEVPEQASSHEEADTRLLLHASHAAQEDHRAVIVVTEDTDVFFRLSIRRTMNTTTLQKCGSKTRTKLIDI